MNIARISNKYSFKTIETWALDAIQVYVNRTIIPPSTFGAPIPRFPGPNSNIKSTAQLTQLFRLAQLCNHQPLLTTMITIVRQLMSVSLQYAYLAMTLADELDLRSLRGAAYLEVMQNTQVVKRAKVNGISASPAEVVAVDDTSGGDRLVVNKAQQVRLLAGYYRLTDAWERLRMTPPHFDHAVSCGATWHQHGCNQSWVDFWKEKTRTDAILSLGLADVLGRLRQVQKDYDRWGSATYMHHDCRTAARRSISETIKTVETALPDYFADSGDE